MLGLVRADHDRVGALVRQQLVHARCDHRDPEAFGLGRGVPPSRRRDAAQLHVTHGLEIGQMHAENVVAEPDQGDPDLAVRPRPGADPDRLTAIWVRPVRDQRGHPGQGVLTDGVERLLSALHRVNAGDQRLGVDGADGDKPDELFQVALLGPANVAERVVDPALLVAGVIASRPVGARVPQIDLVIQEVLRVDIELDVADHNHPALPPGDLHR